MQLSGRRIRRSACCPRLPGCSVGSEQRRLGRVSERGSRGSRGVRATKLVNASCARARKGDEEVGQRESPPSSSQSCRCGIGPASRPAKGAIMRDVTKRFEEMRMLKQKLADKANASG
jgi:hypothetical protein